MAVGWDLTGQLSAILVWPSILADNTEAIFADEAPDKTATGL